LKPRHHSCCPSLIHSPRHLTELAKANRATAPPPASCACAVAPQATKARPHLRRHLLYLVRPPMSCSGIGESEFRRFHFHRHEPTSPEFMLAMVDTARASSSLRFLLGPLRFALGKLVPSSAWPMQPHHQRIAAATWPSAIVLAVSGARLGLGVHFAHQSFRLVERVMVVCFVSLEMPPTASSAAGEPLLCFPLPVLMLGRIGHRPSCPCWAGPSGRNRLDFVLFDLFQMFVLYSNFVNSYLMF
jgi:hypothetical protein